MPKYDSPIGSKHFQGQSMRDFSVPDESGGPPPQYQQSHDFPNIEDDAMRDFQSRMQPPMPQIREVSDVEKQIFEAKKAKREGKERLSDGAKRRIEMLVGMTRLTRDMEIDGKLYRLQTLTSKELREAIVATAEFDGTVQFVFETRKQLLARSLIVVAGIEIADFLSSYDLSARLDFIEEMDHSLLLRIYNEYTIMAREAQDKYAIKTDAEVKEVLTDLKK